MVRLAASPCRADPGLVRPRPSNTAPLRRGSFFSRCRRWWSSRPDHAERGDERTRIRSRLSISPSVSRNTIKRFLMHYGSRAREGERVVPPCQKGSRRFPSPWRVDKISSSATRMGRCTPMRFVAARARPGPGRARALAVRAAGEGATRWQISQSPLLSSSPCALRALSAAWPPNPSPRRRPARPACRQGRCGDRTKGRPGNRPWPFSSGRARRACTTPTTPWPRRSRRRRQLPADGHHEVSRETRAAISPAAP
jgi:hypothetical protein